MRTHPTDDRREPGSSFWRRLAAAAARRFGLGRGPTGEAIVSQFARTLRGTHTPAELRSALVYLAHRISGACRVELHLDDRPGRPPRCVAGWPGAAVSDAHRAPAPTAAVVTLPLQFEGRIRGLLRLVPARGPIRSRAVLRRLEMLCVLAAAAELRSGRPDDADAAHDPVTGAYNAAYLGAFLSHALARARRRIEPLTLLNIELDRLAALRGRPGGELADIVLGRAARAMLETLRASDVVGRLDADRLVAVLPGCDVKDGLRLARVVRQAIAEALLASGIEAAPAVLIGVASYPDHALESGPLLAAAGEALARARIGGPGADAVATAPTLRAAPRPSRLLQRVGSPGPEGSGLLDRPPAWHNDRPVREDETSSDRVVSCRVESRACRCRPIRDGPRSWRSS
jgi:diguanylate cyclase (GGDEF)-like protein